jgi:hypothetical protein
MNGNFETHITVSSSLAIHILYNAASGRKNKCFSDCGDQQFYFSDRPRFLAELGSSEKIFMLWYSWFKCLELLPCINYDCW